MLSDHSLVRRSIDAAFPDIASEITPLKAGYSSQPYKVTNELGDFIALAEKPEAIGTVTYSFCFAILTTLEKQKYPFAPRAIYINPERTVIIMTFAPGPSLKEFSDRENTETTAKKLLIALLELQKIPFDDCLTEYKALETTTLNPVTIQDDIAHFLIGWGNLTASGQPDPVLQHWLSNKTAQTITTLQHTPPSGHLILNHDDTTEGNVFMPKNGTPILIDWAESRFQNYPLGWHDYGIGYLLNHVRLFQKHAPFILQYACEYMGRDMESKNQRIRRTVYKK